MINKPEEKIKPPEISTSESNSHAPITIPSALITAKPPANVEQQRAIITRVKRIFYIEKENFSSLTGNDPSRFC